MSQHYKSIGITVLVAVMFIFSPLVKAQQPDTLKFWQKAPEYRPSRGRLLLGTLGGGYVTSMTFLYTEWYSQEPQTSFHFFNDDAEWLQMDKCGHFGSNYYISKWVSQLAGWSGANQTKAAWVGAGSGFIFQLTIEAFDGFSRDWGASPGDIAANTAGAGLFLVQELNWKEQRIQVKWSYHDDQYPKYNPNLLGSSFQERMLKNYNGQTYWLSGNIRSFFPGNKSIPAWLNLAVGYGADGMLGGRNNNLKSNGEAVPQFKRVRQFYLSPDIDLTRLHPRSGFLKTICQTFGFLKFPLPAVQLNENGRWKFYPIYF